MAAGATARDVPITPEGFEPPPSIHAREAAAHAGEQEIPNVFTFTVPPFAAGTRAARPTVTKDVFGWLPHWQWSSLGNLRWDVLTHVAYFSADVTSTGDISSTNSWTSRAATLVGTAHPLGVKVLLAATNFSPSEQTTLLSSSAYRQNAIDNLVALVAPYGADGIAIDFEMLPVSQKANMVQFLKELKAQLHAQVPQGDVWVATPAVDWSGAWDYDQIMDNIDGTFVMAYDYYWSGSSVAGPVSPLTSGTIWGTYNVMWTIGDYRAYGIARAMRKVILGFPYYGYSWPTVSTSIPSNTTGSGSAVLYTTAAAEAQTYGRGWEPNAQNPYYMKPGPVQVWYDDDQSLGLKVDAMLAERLGGTGMWALGYDGTRPELVDTLKQKLVRMSLAGLKVGIDAGAGGSDAGAIGPTGLAEKVVTLEIAQELAALLAAHGATVVMTRTTDVDLTGAQRVAALNAAQVDRAISIHLGSANPSTNEAAVCVYGSDVVGSLSDGRSEDWAAAVLERLAAYAQIGKAASNTGVAGVVAIDDALVRDTEMTSILTRGSDITNAAEEARLRDPIYVCGIAYELYRGLADSLGIAAAPSSCATQPRPVAIAGAGASPSNAPRIRAFELASGSTPVLDIVAYGATGYGAKGTGGDLDGDGRGEIVTGPGPGAVYGPQVRAFDGAGVPIGKVNFFAYGTLRYGVNVGTGDVDLGQRDAMLTGAGPGPVFGPHVRGWQRAGNGVAPLKNLSYYAYQTLKYGARTAGGSIDPDGRAEIATAPGPGPSFGPQIRGWDYQSSVSAIAKVNFWAYPQVGGGAKVDVALLDGDGFEEIATGRGEAASMGAEAKAFDYDGVAVALMPGIDVTPFATVWGINVGGADVDVDGRDELVAGAGPDPSATSRLRAYDVDGGSPVLVPGLDFDAYAGQSYGIEVGGGSL
ncbi:MAG: glycosyl hydrolase family 18 protein [Acidobacteriota bacterium]